MNPLFTQIAYADSRWAQAIPEWEKSRKEVISDLRDAIQTGASTEDIQFVVDQANRLQARLDRASRMTSSDPNTKEYATQTAEMLRKKIVFPAEAILKIAKAIEECSEKEGIGNRIASMYLKGMCITEKLEISFSPQIQQLERNIDHIVKQIEEVNPDQERYDPDFLLDMQYYMRKGVLENQYLFLSQYSNKNLTIPTNPEKPDYDRDDGNFLFGNANSQQVLLNVIGTERFPIIPETSSYTGNGDQWSKIRRWRTIGPRMSRFYLYENLRQDVVRLSREAAPATEEVSRRNRDELNQHLQLRLNRLQKIKNEIMHLNAEVVRLSYQAHGRATSSHGMGMSFEERQSQAESLREIASIVNGEEHSESRFQAVEGAQDVYRRLNQLIEEYARITGELTHQFPTSTLMRGKKFSELIHQFGNNRAEMEKHFGKMRKEVYEDLTFPRSPESSYSHQKFGIPAVSFLEHTTSVRFDDRFHFRKVHKKDVDSMIQDQSEGVTAFWNHMDEELLNKSENEMSDRIKTFMKASPMTAAQLIVNNPANAVKACYFFKQIMSEEENEAFWDAVFNKLGLVLLGGTVLVGGLGLLGVTGRAAMGGLLAADAAYTTTDFIRSELSLEQREEEYYLGLNALRAALPEMNEEEVTVLHDRVKSAALRRNMNGLGTALLIAPALLSVIRGKNLRKIPTSQLDDVVDETVEVIATRANANETERMVDELAKSMHTKWRKGYVRDNGTTANWKKVPTLEGETAEQALARFKSKGYDKGLDIQEGKLVQNINQSADEIIPELNHVLNGTPAKRYTELLLDKELITVSQVDQAASDIHEIWMELFPWEKTKKPHLFVPYDKLTTAEKLKDLDVLEESLSVIRPETLKSEVFGEYRRSLEAELGQ